MADQGTQQTPAIYRLMTAAEARVYEGLRTLIKASPHLPTQREIAASIDRSEAEVNRILQKLDKHGLLRSIGSGSRRRYVPRYICLHCGHQIAEDKGAA